MAVRRPTLSVLPDLAVLQEWQMVEIKPTRQVKSVCRVFWEQSESFHTQASLSMLKSSVNSKGHAILSTGRQVPRKVVRGSPCNRGLHSEVEGYIPGTSNAILLATTSHSLLLQVAQTTLCRIGKKWKDAVIARRYYTDICRRV